MNEQEFVPGLPRSPAPADLLEIADSLSHPLVAQTGITTTKDGRWALLVRVHHGVPTPVREVDLAAGEHPVVYQVAPEVPPVARPAFPDRGE
jgi:hypothetical protein